jgi:hypothetical protein
VSLKVTNLLDQLQVMLQQGSYSDLEWKIVQTLNMIAAETGVDKSNGEPIKETWYKYPPILSIDRYRRGR